MRTMTWEEIDKDWAGLQKRHRMEIAEAVARYSVGHKIDEIAHHLKFSAKWVVQQLNYVGLGIAVGGGEKFSTPPGKAGEPGVDHAVSRIVREFGPSIKVSLQDDGKGNQSIETVEGDDAEAFQPYLQYYVEQGHEPAAAIRLAKAEWAGEEAVNAGVIKEGKNKRDERVNRILFPSDDKDTFELRLREHMARVELAAKFLDEAKVPFLKRKSTCKKVAAANAKWVEQVDRIRNLHPTFDEVS